MRERDEKRGGPGAIALIGAILILLPTLYLLASGPVLWLAWKDYLPRAPVMVLYFPLHYLGEHCEPLGQLIFGYERLFAPPPLKSLAELLSSHILAGSM